MHFDSDNEGRGGVRNPIVRYVNGLVSYASNGIYAKERGVKVAPAFVIFGLRNRLLITILVCRLTALMPLDEQPSNNSPH